MNRQLTLYLLACVVFLGLMIIFLDSSSWFQEPSKRSRSPRVIEVDPHEIMRVRVLRDYWNTFTLSRNEEGNWSLTEPSNEPARFDQTSRLIDTLATLPLVDTLGSVTDDSERYHEYGLWDPSVQVYVTSDEREWRLAFGNKTSNGQGVYVTRADNDEVFITSKEAFDVITTEAELYRDTKPSSSDNNSSRSSPFDR